jgi:signal transduction histidine kinase
VTVLAVSAVAAEAYLVQYHGHQGVMVVAAPLVAVCTVADVAPRRRGLTVAVAVLLTFGVAHVLVRPHTWLGTDNLAVAALGGMAIAAGTANRNRRAYLREAQARAAQAEADREAEATRRVTRERLRISRDLHDAVGHQLALISVQARVAAHLLDEEPVRAREALTHVHQAARVALDELTDTIGLLRQAGDAAPVTPAPTLADLDDLLAGFRRSGLDITARVDGTPGPLPPGVDRGAYRVLQEALTNVCKHAGPTRVRVHLDYRPDGLHLAVRNDPTGRPAGDTPAGRPIGHGVAGMRERVTALGGQLSAQPAPDGGFAVRALLPLPAGVGG